LQRQPQPVQVSDKIREWLRMGEVAVSGANRMSQAEYEHIVANQRKGDKAEDTDTVVVEEEPALRLRVCNECGLEAWTQEDLEFFVKSPRSRYGRMKLCKECHRSMFRKGGKYTSEKSTEPEAEVAELASDPDDDGAPGLHTGLSRRY